MGGGALYGIVPARGVESVGEAGKGESTPKSVLPPNIPCLRDFSLPTVLTAAITVHRREGWGHGGAPGRGGGGGGKGTRGAALVLAPLAAITA